MKITITIKILETAKTYDVSVDTTQRIITTLKVMHENLPDFPKLELIKDIRYGEKMRHVLMESTYEQSNIFSGDILCLITSDNENDTEHADQKDEGTSSILYRTICKETYKKSDFYAKDTFDFASLIQENDGLLNCTYIEEGEDIFFVYDVYEKNSIKNIRKESMQAKYRFLINVSEFLDILDKYDVLLDDGNIYCDRNYLLYGKKRDKKSNNSLDKVQIYKAFIGTVMGERYGINDYLYGGTEIIEEEKWFAPYKNLKSVYEIRETLVSNFENYNEKHKKTKKEVSRIANLIKTISLVGISFLSIIMTSLFIYYGGIIYPLHISLLNGEKAFLRKEYVTCIDALRSVDVENMDYETKYILALSYAKTENLNREELTNIVDKLSLTSGERELDYWVYLGREDFGQAEDAAKFLMDDRLLAYAYMKEYNQLESETQITGEEKEQRMNELKTLIEELGKKYAPEE